MDTSVSCPGCGRDVPLLSDDLRSEIRCPACNFRFARPARRERPRPEDDAITARPSARRSCGNAAAVVSCAHCGETLRASSDTGTPVRCPVCGNPLDAITHQPAAQPAQPAQPARPARSEQVRAAVTDITATPRRALGDEDDETPYGFAEPVRHCPHCDRELPGAAVVCLGCGFNQETGEVLVREYTQVWRTWEGSLSLQWRLILFGIGETLPCSILVGAALGDFLVTGLVGWVLATALLAYILGTFYRVEVSRTPGGQLRAAKCWRFCFIPLRPTLIQLRRYEGVRMSKVPSDTDVWDWTLLLILISYGGIPGVIWWCFAFQRDQFYVGLLQHHGSVVLELYRGWDEALAQDMMKVIRDVGGFLD